MVACTGLGLLVFAGRDVFHFLKHQGHGNALTIVPGRRGHIAGTWTVTATGAQLSYKWFDQRHDVADSPWTRMAFISNTVPTVVFVEPSEHSRSFVMALPPLPAIIVAVAGALMVICAVFLGTRACPPKDT